jgi:Trk K+ transport system NAD-binding subunit
MVQVLKPWWSSRRARLAGFHEVAPPLEGHIIVSGDDDVATTIVHELTKAGAHVVKLAATELADAGVARALAVVCAGDEDSTNIEIALLARKANPDVRVVMRLDNDRQ